MMIRVLVADGQRVVAEALRSLVEREPDMEVVGCVGEGREAVMRVEQDPPDVVLMEYRLAGLNGIDAAEMIRRRVPSARMLMLSTESAALLVVRALEAGVAGYMPKDCSAADLLQAIRVVSAGHRYVHASLAGAVLQVLTHPSQSRDRLTCLSSRELQVVQMMVEGRTNGQIAGALYLSPKTVSTYRTRVMEKLELPDLPSLVRFAMQHGIGALPEPMAP
jgi:DNA-binding NarL/FixJ family response regulator